ncbi:MAG: hypothetical protein WAM42_24835 [Candidatus Nitrosopolaris sp.]
MLTDDDREVIDQIVVICVAIMYFITTKYTAKQLGEKYILSFSSKKKNTSLMHLLLNATNKTNGKLYSPKELNKEIARVLTEQQDANDTTAPSSDQVNGYLGSSHMTENLRLLEALDAYQNITNKKQIKHQDKGVVRDDRGGKPSRYRITTKVENIKNLMNKPEACDLLRNRLFKLKIFYEYQKLVITGLFYAAKKNKTIIKNLCRVFLPLGFENIVETFINKLSSIGSILLFSNS